MKRLSFLIISFLCIVNAVAQTTNGQAGMGHRISAKDGIASKSAQWVTGTTQVGKYGLDVNVLSMPTIGGSSTVAVSNFPTFPASFSVSNFPGATSVNNFPSSQFVTGAFYQSVQPVSIAVMPTTAVTGQFWQSVQPVSLTGTLLIRGSWLYANITGNVTSVVQTGATTLHAVCFNAASTGGTITVYNNTSAIAPKVATYLLGTAAVLGANPTPTCLTALDIELSTGLTVTTAGAAGNDVTLIYR